MQGGTLWVESEEGKGTTFSFTIPYDTSKAQLLEEPTSSFNFNDNAFAYKKVLMAEDVLVNQFLARVILESVGFIVDIANNGIQALELLEKNDYDLILMDVQMPEMDGVTATKKIRQMNDVGKASIPIVALTANALVGNEKEYYEAGMNACLTKPFTQEKLFAILTRLLNPTLDLKTRHKNG